MNPVCVSLLPLFFRANTNPLEINVTVITIGRKAQTKPLGRKFCSVKRKLCPVKNKFCPVKRNLCPVKIKFCPVKSKFCLALVDHSLNQPSEKDLNNHHGFKDEEFDKRNFLAKIIHSKATFDIFKHLLCLGIISCYPNFAHLKIFLINHFIFGPSPGYK